MGNKIKVKKVFHDLRKMLTWSFIKGLAINPSQLIFTTFLILAAELVLNILIVERVPYTEIDWKAYMQECEGFLNGTYNYSELRGDTGPLVYPAGFVYIYSILYFVTGYGSNVRLAQYIFIVIYLLQLYFALRIYMKTRKVPPYALVITILTSYRIHSIYVLRLFNDPIAVLLFYISLNMFLDSKWYLGSAFYSLAVSVKMNILLYAPALFFFYMINLGLKHTIVQLFVCGLLQLVLGLPFLINSPAQYLKGSFDIGRVFNHTWTVNYRFLDVEVFENKYFHFTLLMIHVMLLLIFLPMCIKYFQSYCRMKYVQHQVQPQIDAKNIENKKYIQIKGKRKDNFNEEQLSKKQEEFINSFESMLKKSQKSVKKAVNKQVEKKEHYSINYDVLSQLFVLPMFLVNFIGVICARSLHYQFYSWYFHSLPYLLWCNNYTVIVRFLILALIELCWNTYPSTNFTSILLHFCHIAVLYGVYKKMSTELKLVSKVE